MVLYLGSQGAPCQTEVDAAVHGPRMPWQDRIMRVRYDFETDPTGDPSILFGIVLKDEAAKDRKVNDVAHDVARVPAHARVKSEEHGLHWYFNSRDAAKQVRLKEATIPIRNVSFESEDYRSMSIHIK